MFGVSRKPWIYEPYPMHLIWIDEVDLRRTSNFLRMDLRALSNAPNMDYSDSRLTAVLMSKVLPDIST